MASDGKFSDRHNIPVPGDGQDEPSDDATQARSITNADAENWADIIQTILLSDDFLDGKLVGIGSLASRPAAGTSAPQWYLVTSGGESGDQPYLTYNDDTRWHLVTPMPAERLAIAAGDSPYAASFGETVWVDASGGAVQVDLPPPRDRGLVRVVVIDATNDVTIARSGLENIDGSASDIVRTEPGATELESDGVDWWRTTMEPEEFVTRVQLVVDAPNGHVPTAFLEDTESAEISVPVPDGETLTVYRWGCWKLADSTAPAGLRVELLDDADTVQAQENTVNTENLNGVASHANTSGTLSIFKLRVKNATGSHFTTDGVGAHFGYVIE